MRYLSKLPEAALADKRVLIRCGLNAPYDESGNIVNDFRIKAAIPTLRYVAARAQEVTVIAHHGRERTDSLMPVIARLQAELAEYTNIIYRENLRQDPREVANDEDFAQELVQGHDIFVQDAFSVCHRAHASIVSIPKFLPSYAGLVLEAELKHLSAALKPERPALFVLGGAKFATKEPLIRRFLERYDKIFIGGAIANEFFAARGYEIGYSLKHDGKIPSDLLYHPNIILPEQVLIEVGDGRAVHCHPKEVPSNARIVDVTPPSDLVSNPDMQFVLWNGPLGYYEGGYTTGTLALKTQLEHSRAHVVVGGGDTLASIGGEPINARTYLSIGGGAMLAFLQEGTLPGITALS